MTAVVVTGSTGRLGSCLLGALHAAGHNVRGFDIRSDNAGLLSTVGSILDHHALRVAFDGADAVVHAAALLPRGNPPEQVFDSITRGTWCVFHAAAEAGVRRVVHISSECATGLCYQRDETPPRYLPVDEAHPLSPTDPYSLGKQLSEQIALSFTRAGRLSTVVLRPTYIFFPEQYDQLNARQDLWHADLWSYVDPTDVASAVLAALRLDTAYEVFFVSAAETISEEPTLELVRRRWGALPPVRDPGLYETMPHAALYSIAAARARLGYAPAGLWRAMVGGAV